MPLTDGHPGGGRQVDQPPGGNRETSAEERARPEGPRRSMRESGNVLAVLCSFYCTFLVVALPVVTCMAMATVFTSGLLRYAAVMGLAVAVSKIVFVTRDMWRAIRYREALEQQLNAASARPVRWNVPDSRGEGPPLEILAAPPKDVVLNISDTCVVCLDSAAKLAFVPCGHACVCSSAMCSALHVCPLCRTSATQLCQLGIGRRSDGDSEPSEAGGEVAALQDVVCVIPADDGKGVPRAPHFSPEEDVGSAADDDGEETERELRSATEG